MHGYSRNMRRVCLLTKVSGWLLLCSQMPIAMSAESMRPERQITDRQQNHVLTNIGVWSSDAKWIYYDVRSDLAGSVFDSPRIERVAVDTGEVEVVYESANGASCGVVTASPVDSRIVFIGGPENPTADWQYSAWHRQGIVVDTEDATRAAVLDARDLVPPYTPGALRGGTHVHVFSGDGQWVSFTYEDHVLATSSDPTHQKNLRNVGVTAPCGPVMVPKTHPRNHDGTHFCALVTETTEIPVAGSDEINRAYSDAWIGTHGYVRSDGERQRRAIAFLGDAVARDGSIVTELYVVDIPDDIRQTGDHPLCGTPRTRPGVPLGTMQRRLTHTEARRFPGVGGVRHWPRSSPDGEKIAFLMRDDSGVLQLWTITPRGDGTRQLTTNPVAIESAFSWSPDGASIACVVGGRVCEIDSESGTTHYLTGVADARGPLRPEACVYSPDGSHIAYLRSVPCERGLCNQIFVVASSRGNEQEGPSQ